MFFIMPLPYVRYVFIMVCLVLGARHYSFSVDIWSVGCIFGELLGRRILFQVSLHIPAFIRRQCCGSGIFYPGSESKNLNILAQKMVSKPRKYDQGCSSRIPYPGVKKASDPGFATLFVCADDDPL
jgi:hypothetical protein